MYYLYMRNFKPYLRDAKDMGSIPGLGRFHMPQVCAPEWLKPVHLEPVLCNKRSHHNEKPAHRSEE